MNINIVAERINRGLSIPQAALAMGIGRETLRSAEADLPDRPAPGTAKKIADFYGYKVTDIWPIEGLEPAA